LEPSLFEENPFLNLIAHRLLKAREQGDLLLQNGDSGFASAPSNIALLKYWGKQSGRRQIPENSSLSLSLGNYRSTTRVSVAGRFFPLKNGHPVAVPESRPEFSLSLNGRSEIMPAKMEKFLRNILAVYAPDVALHVESYNNFPTACGVASSASGYAAIVGAVADLLNLRRFISENELQLWLAEWSRLGSGSATRSAVLNDEAYSAGFANQFVAWELIDPDGAAATEGHLTQTHACVVHPKLKVIRHCLLVLDASPKATGSSEGHELTRTSSLQSIRLAHYPLRYQQMCDALSRGDFARVAELSETDAFEMHAVMGTGAVPLHYLTSKTAAALKVFVEERNRSKAAMFWTLDAGPNPHFIFDAEAAPHLAEVFKRLAADANFTSARVLISVRSVPNAILTGQPDMNHGRVTHAHLLSQPLLEEHDLQSASQCVSKLRTGE
jgi:diphosphomevalonate decarboxylase